VPAVGSQVGRSVGSLNAGVTVVRDLTTDAPVDGNVVHYI